MTCSICKRSLARASSARFPRPLRLRARPATAAFGLPQSSGPVAGAGARALFAAARRISPARQVVFFRSRISLIAICYVCEDPSVRDRGRRPITGPPLSDCCVPLQSVQLPLDFGRLGQIGLGRRPASRASCSNCSSRRASKACSDGSTPSRCGAPVVRAARGRGRVHARSG